MQKDEDDWSVLFKNVHFNPIRLECKVHGNDHLLEELIDNSEKVFKNCILLLENKLIETCFNALVPLKSSAGFAHSSENCNVGCGYQTKKERSISSLYSNP